jgi:glycyl-tRNA synthetase
LKLKSHLSPIKAAVIPLKRNNSDLVNLANKIKGELQSLGLGRVMIENSGNIGKNYRRHDEIGTPMCITIDFETLENQSVTVRDRDTMKQERVDLNNISTYYSNYFKKN